MKIFMLITLCLVTLVSGWYSLPFIIHPLSGNCHALNTLIYDEPERTIISRADWDVLPGSHESHLNGYLEIYPAMGSSSRIDIERTINHNVVWHINSATLTSEKSFRIAGPETSDPLWGRYIDPIADENFTGRMYLFKIGERTVTGYYNRPFYSCMK